jgi:hypothetical protein
MPGAGADGVAAAALVTATDGCRRLPATYPTAPLKNPIDTAKKANVAGDAHSKDDTRIPHSFQRFFLARH